MTKQRRSPCFTSSNPVDASVLRSILEGVEATHSKKPMTGSEVRKVFAEARRKRLENPMPPLTLEMMRKQQDTMKSHK